MFKRIRPSVGSAHVIALLALFVALGGGYATAFSGSGSLKKATGLASETSTFTTIRTVPGIGSIQARCQNDADDELEIRYLNTTSTPIIRAATFQEGQNIYDSSNVPGNGAGGTEDQIIESGTQETIRWQFMNAQFSKTPMADVWVHGYNATENCQVRPVWVLALSTEE